MNWDTIVAVLAIVLALGFDFVNGFQDTANAVATVIYTKALKPGVAILMAGTLNFVGAVLAGTAVAMVITKIIPQQEISLTLVVSVLLAALMWNLFTWWHGLPISSSHCLIGSLFGAGMAANGLHGVSWHELQRVLTALLISPVLGFGLGALLTWMAWNISGEKHAAKGKKNQTSSKVMRWLHVLSSASVSFSHGSNDGQKTMGVITIVLASHFARFGYTYDKVPLWVMAAAALAIGLGTTIGGWRVIRTVGTKISRERLSHSQGFGASMATAGIILAASSLGAPVSTTHTLSSAVAGGTLPIYGHETLNFKTLKLILLAWVLTLPVACTLAAVNYTVLRFLWHP